MESATFGTDASNTLLGKSGVGNCSGDILEMLGLEQVLNCKGMISKNDINSYLIL